ncbi:MAG: molybdate ABC transporter substrate-binding protein [Pseudomonadota bacterium]
MKTYNWIKGLALLLALLCASFGAGAEPLRIFAAASLQGPLDQVAADHRQDSTISFGGSGTMARQVSLGAPADAVILANEKWARWLFDNGHAPNPPRALLSNRLVVIGDRDAAILTNPDQKLLKAALGDGRFAMAQHQSVPAGIYAKAWLTRLGAWNDLRTQLAETDSVRAALALVARGEAPLGIVYASDAQASPDVRILWTIPEDQHPQILYHGLALTPQGATFLDHLASDTAPFVAVGFKALP